MSTTAFTSKSGAIVPQHTQQNSSIAHSVLDEKKIIFLFNSLELGGAERQAIHLAAHLKRGFRAHVEVWAFSPPGRAAVLCDSHGIPHRSLENPLKGNSVQKLVQMAGFARELFKARPDILLPYTMAQNVICGLIWRLTGAKLCVWNQRDEGRRRIGGKAEKWAVRLTPVFISNSSHAGEFLSGTLGAQREKVHVVRNGVVLPTARESRQAWRAANGVPQDHFVASMVANLHSYKDHATLLRAWQRVVQRLSQYGLGATLLLAGRFEDTADTLRSLADELNLGGSVRFLGPVADVASLLGAVDLGVFSSRFEGCPNGVLECMAAGLAVVATDIPGIREALGDQSQASLAPEGDFESMASHIVSLAVDERLRNHHAQQNLARVKGAFSLERMCGESVSLIVTAFNQH